MSLGRRQHRFDVVQDKTVIGIFCNLSSLYKTAVEFPVLSDQRRD